MINRTMLLTLGLAGTLDIHNVFSYQRDEIIRETRTLLSEAADDITTVNLERIGQNRKRLLQMDEAIRRMDNFILHFETGGQPPRPRPNKGDIDDEVIEDPNKNSRIF